MEGDRERLADSTDDRVEGTDKRSGTEDRVAARRTGSNRVWVFPAPEGARARAGGGRSSASMPAAMFTGRRCERIEPRTAVPMVAPMLRKNWTWLVATPTSFRSTAAWTELT